MPSAGRIAFDLKYDAVSEREQSTQGLVPMNPTSKQPKPDGWSVRSARAVGPSLLVPAASHASLARPRQAGKLSWLDDVVQDVIVEAKAGGKRLVRGGDGAHRASARAGCFSHKEADDGIEHLVRRADELARAGRRFEQPSEALLKARFSRLLKQDPQVLRTFDALAPAEKRLVVSWARPHRFSPGVIRRTPRRWSAGWGPG